jgi:3-hydroxyisobutyryl-CoA hydrolase
VSLKKTKKITKINDFISKPTHRQLYNLIKDLSVSSKSHIIIQGSGKAFCAGLDLKEIFNVPLNEINKLNHFTSNAMDLIQHIDKPYVALIDGICMGGACFYSMTAKYRIATERTIFAMPETEIGFFTNAGASFVLPRLKYNLGFYIALAGARLYGYDTKKFGLASHFVESKRMEELVRALAGCKGDAEVAKTIAKFSSVPNDLHSDLDGVLPTVDKCFDGDSVEEIVDNLHLDGSEWAMQTVRSLNKMSPTSLKICHRLLTMGKELSLRECLKLEHLLTNNITERYSGDFREGVRALIIEKDLKPKWNPKTLHEVKSEDLDGIFADLDEKLVLRFERGEKAKL